jgi:transcriptional regulator with XRE-family HTH domain
MRIACAGEIPLARSLPIPGTDRDTFGPSSRRIVNQITERVNTIGEYLRARRELVRPEDVGLPEFGTRRVPGLRREEVAMLAGVSTEYYLRLEQGRDHHPSEQVLDALARALHLDADATEHLHRLARPAPKRNRSRQAPERAPQGVELLIASWSQTPAYIHGRYLDVLTANPLATALIPFCRPGINLVRACFLDPAAPELFEDWDQLTNSAAASLRALVGPAVDDPRLTELVGELSVRSERFRQLWGRHDVRPKAPGHSTLHHPQLGPLQLRYEKLAIDGSDSQSLIAYHAEPGTDSAHKLALLASIVAEERLKQPATTPRAY